MPVALLRIFKPAPEMPIFKVHSEPVKCGIMQTKMRHYRITYNKSTFAFGEPIRVRVDWEAARNTPAVSCIKFKIKIKCAWQPEKTVYRVKFTRDNFKIVGKSHQSINVHFAVHNINSPTTIFTARSMMPPSYPGYISYTVTAKIEDDTVFGVAKYCEPMAITINLCKEIWAASNAEGFQSIEFDSRPEDEKEIE